MVTEPSAAGKKNPSALSAKKNQTFDAQKKSLQPSEQESLQPPGQGSRGERKKIIVMKFGGTSVNSRANWDIIRSLILKYHSDGYMPVLALSALSGISDELDRSINDTLAGEEPEVFWQKIKKVHEDFARELDLSAQTINSHLEELHSWLKGLALTREDSPSLRAKILCCGEYFLTRLAHAFLVSSGVTSQWIDVRKWLTAQHTETSHPGGINGHYLAAQCDCSYDPKLSQQCRQAPVQALITQGFIARDSAGKTVLLGRGGSDTSAAYLAVKLGAERLEIWTDVPGIFTANPNVIPSARLLKKLGYDEAQELASSGAKVLHPRCLEPVRKAGIGLDIRWTARPHQTPHTKVREVSSSRPQVKGISTKYGVLVLSMESVRMWHQTGFLADLFSVFKKHQVSVDSISTSESNVTVTLDSPASMATGASLDDLMAELARYCRPKLYTDCVSISLVGRRIRSILHVLAPVLMAFEDKKVFLVSGAANDLNFSFTVESGEAERLLRHLHELLFSRTIDEEIFGPSWSQIIEKFSGGDAQHHHQSSSKPHTAPWWLQESERLVALMPASGSPCAGTKSLYVYHRPTISARLRELSGADSVDRMFYAVKANPHPEILCEVAGYKVGFDCVSWGEVEHLRASIPGLAPSSILFTPNFAPISEYAAAVKAGIVVTVDNLNLLKAHGSVFSGYEVMIRVDPGVGRGHHKHVRTAGQQSKFGITLEDIPEVIEQCRYHKITIMGLHCHLGSGILSPESWSQSALSLAQLTEKIPSARVLDLGGGFAVPEKPQDPRFALEIFNRDLSLFRQAFPRFEIWIEPGRYAVAEAGALLVQVTQVKSKGSKTFVGVSAGMNALLRPALYGAYHHIVNLSAKKGEVMSLLADVVGPICESGDVLGYGRLLPPTKEGDILLVATVGAYGSVMSSDYNHREPAGEIILGGETS